MEPKTFINQLDDAKLVAAIARAEERTSGEIRLFVSHKKVEDALGEAKKQFLKLGMEKTAERNAVLIYIAPEAQKFAIVGDSGVHAKCGDGFWNSTSAAMRPLLREGKFTEALLGAIAGIGEVLGRHFPHRDGDRNELPNEIEGD